MPNIREVLFTCIALVLPPLKPEQGEGGAKPWDWKFPIRNLARPFTITFCVYVMLLSLHSQALYALGKYHSWCFWLFSCNSALCKQIVFRLTVRWHNCHEHELVPLGVDTAGSAGWFSAWKNAVGCVTVELCLVQYKCMLFHLQVWHSYRMRDSSNFAKIASKCYTNFLMLKIATGEK